MSMPSLGEMSERIDYSLQLADEMKLHQRNFQRFLWDVDYFFECCKVIDCRFALAVAPTYS